MLHRRTVLQAGLVGAAALAVGGVGASVLTPPGPEPDAPLRALSLGEFRTLAAVADRMFESDTLPSARDLRVAEGVDALLATLHPGAVADVKQVLDLLDSAIVGLVLDGRAAPFARCAPDLQRQILRGWATSRIPTLRTAYRALHGLCMGVAWSDPRLHAAAGYPGPPEGLAALAPPPDGEPG
jgi:hypothetical protein